MKRVGKGSSCGCLFILLAGLFLLGMMSNSVSAAVNEPERQSYADSEHDGSSNGIRYQIGNDAVSPGRIVHVGFNHMPDFQECDINGKHAGYNYELLQMMNFYSDWSFSYDGYENTWDEMLQKLENGEIDMLVMAEKTPERESSFLFSDVPIGQQREVLVTRRGNTLLDPDKIETYNGIRVGTIRGTMEGENFQRYAASHDINFVLVELDNPDEAREALLEGDVDALAKGIMTLEPHEKLLLELSSKPCYIMLNKNNKGLKREVDEALGALNRFYPDWQIELNEHYASPAGVESLLLQAKDRIYLNELKKARRVFWVAAMPDNAPYSYLEDGEFKGIIPDIFRLVAERLGISYHFLNINTRKEYEEIAGTADIILNKETQYSMAENAGLKLSRTVLELPTAEVRRQDAQGEVHRVAVPRYPDMFSRMIDVFSERVEFVTYDSVRECIDAVHRGECDAAYLFFYTAQQWVQAANQDDTIDALRMTMLPDKRLRMSFAVAAARDYRLGRLLNLGLGTVTETYIRGLEAKYTTLQVAPQTLSSFLRSHPVIALGLGFVILLALLALMRYRILMQKKSEEKALQASYADFWTGRHNRHWFESSVLHIAEGFRQVQEEHRLVVAVVSLSRGGVFQDNYGREVLKACIINLADAFAKEKDFVRAVGITTTAQKLYLLLTVPPEQNLQARMETMLAQNASATFGGSRIRLNLKAGCVYVIKIPFEPSVLTGWAETALETVRNSVGTVAIFDKQQREHLKQQRRVENYMEKGLKQKEIKLYCQPKYDIATHRCIGAEALTRWNSPELGFLGPGEFVPVFERNGFILPFDFYMLEQTCEMQRRRLDAGLKVVPVSVNQSRLHFNEPDYLLKMRQVAEKYRLPAGIIELEITETLFADFDNPRQIDNCIAIMNDLHKMGFGLSMDDFGSGYSSLTMVARLPLDVIKIDRALLLAAEEDERRRTVLNSSINLGHDLGMTVICEGIETTEQEQLLLASDCPNGQGFLYAKPMPREEFEAFLATH